ncbi:nucleotidyltransferase family protein [Flavobacterium hungaricum]|uniref:Nucleotidyltransferase family protein n=1 Tax=Flavobacterium hungaricum TaxID=2082725 RepID=A0ABR9TLC8_9FLAO|nr:nucleotidyltransferase family protein [Flavobacterium hungaricum]MBE8726176.1 nucleotidyltransferase family protein [Flavobacterium hungaricum]
MFNSEKNTVGIVILAAGNSSRLGQPKQLLKFREKSLLENSILEASKTANSIVVAVLGSHHELIENEIPDAEITKILNSEWESGMASSIVKGLSKLLELDPDCEQCIFAVCDQPFITTSIFERLIAEFQKTNSGIIASAYSDILGTPVLFHRKYFTELLGLKGKEGAKKLLKKYSDDLVSVPFEKGSIDIDTEEDYNKLIS